ncbi:MAG TPA: hypothetical protein VFT22_07590 [Kofleriaceae bacterium]|nr:hypothetical protein [Kofleriaceae bacterium]
MIPWLWLLLTVLVLALDAAAMSVLLKLAAVRAFRAGWEARQRTLPKECRRPPPARYDVERLIEDYKTTREHERGD